MFGKLKSVEARFVEIESRLSDPQVVGNSEVFRKLSQEHASLQPVVAEYRHYQALSSELQSHQALDQDADPDWLALLKEEQERLALEVASSRKRLQLLLLPQDPYDQKNVIFEIRAGAGGDEASLFVGELFRLYQRYAERQRWKVEFLSANPTGLGGFKEVIVSIQGERVYSRLKWEAGVHRVQRVPATEAQGRVHTSTVTVAVLPEAEEVDVVIQPSELRIDVFRAGGKGGQGVNTTDSAVRVTHLPSGLVVVCQDERSQHKNKDRALKILRSRLLETAMAQASKTHSDARRSMVGTGDRSERVRTYNFPQGRLTDHRIGLTLYQLSEVMEGKIDEILEALGAHYQMEALKQQGLL